MDLRILETKMLQNFRDASQQFSKTQNDINGGNEVHLNIQNNAFIIKTTYQTCFLCK